jgi:hypothetical protein
MKEVSGSAAVGMPVASGLPAVGVLAAVGRAAVGVVAGVEGVGDFLVAAVVGGGEEIGGGGEVVGEEEVDAGGEAVVDGPGELAGEHVGGGFQGKPRRASQGGGAEAVGEEEVVRVAAVAGDGVVLEAGPTGEAAAAGHHELGGEREAAGGRRCGVVAGDQRESLGVAGADGALQGAGAVTQVFQAGVGGERDGRHGGLLPRGLVSAPAGRKEGGGATRTGTAQVGFALPADRRHPACRQPG